MLAQKMSDGVDGVLVCLGVLSVRSSGLSLFITGDGEGGGCGESLRFRSFGGIMFSSCDLSASVLGADLAAFCLSLLRVFVGAVSSFSPLAFWMSVCFSELVCVFVVVRVFLPGLFLLFFLVSATFVFSVFSPMWVGSFSTGLSSIFWFGQWVTLVRKLLLVLGFSAVSAFCSCL